MLHPLLESEVEYLRYEGLARWKVVCQISFRDCHVSVCAPKPVGLVMTTSPLSPDFTAASAIS